MRTQYLLPLVIGACVAFTDQLLKALVVTRLQPGQAIIVLPRLLKVRHVQNPVAAYGALTGLDPIYRVPILVLLPSVVFIALIWTMRRSEYGGRRFLVALSLILGGAMGNLIDRVALGHVTDFLVFRLGRSHSAAYNLADLCILVGITMVLALVFRRWLASDPSLVESVPPKSL